MWKSKRRTYSTSNPVDITVWTYYNGEQLSSFNTLVKKFNRTQGKENGIHVESVSCGTVSDLEKNHIYNSVAINKDIDRVLETINNAEISSSNNDKLYIENIKELEKEILTLKENSFKEEFESLKLEHESLVKNYEDIKSKNDKLTIENKDLSKKIKDNEANSQIAVTQMSFDTIGDNNLKDEILNLDLLNMTPLDAINALYSLQKKAKNN